MAKRPAFQFYPGDWRKDVELRSCSIAARGLWIDMLCIAHECEPYGHLTVNGKPMTPAQIAGQVGLSAKECNLLINELIDNGVARKSAEGSIFSKRMVDDERLRNIRAEAGRLGGNPDLVGKKVKQKVNQTDNQASNLGDKQTPTPSSSSSSSSSSSDLGQNTFVDADASTHSGRPDQPDRSDGNPANQPASETRSANTSGAPPCPHREIISAYNRILPELQAVIPDRWDGTRAKHLQARWRESPKHQTLEFWERFFTVLRNYSWYLGDNDRGWRANLGWIVEKKNFDNLIEKFVTDTRRSSTA